MWKRHRADLNKGPSTEREKANGGTKFIEWELFESWGVLEKGGTQRVRWMNTKEHTEEMDGGERNERDDNKKKKL